MKMLDATDRVYTAAMKVSSDKLLRALTLAQQGEFPLTSIDLQWHDISPGHRFPKKPGCANQLRQEYNLTLIAKKDAVAEANRTNRDPCWRCGVRADAGCNHR